MAKYSKSIFKCRALPTMECKNYPSNPFTTFLSPLRFSNSFASLLLLVVRVVDIVDLLPSIGNIINNKKYTYRHSCCHCSASTSLYIPIVCKRRVLMLLASVSLFILILLCLAIPRTWHPVSLMNSHYLCDLRLEIKLCT